MTNARKETITKDSIIAKASNSLLSQYHGFEVLPDAHPRHRTLM